MKIGRNDPCWCGSNKKYKKCHLDREQQKPLPISDGMQALSAFKKSNQCCCPPDWKDQCVGRPISSHTISKSLGLSALADEGHVLGIKSDISTLTKSNGIPQLGKVGINQLSIFPGFCKHHDKSIFSEIEDKPFTASAKQCALLSYRALARERHTKQAGSSVNEVLKDADKGRPFEMQAFTQMLTSAYGSGVGAAETDLDRGLLNHHEAIVSEDFSRFESLVVEFSDEFPVLCATGHMPSEDWSGKIVQDLGDLKTKADWITSVSFQSGGQAWIVFTYLRSSVKMREFTESLETHYRTNLSDALVKYFFSISENIALRPSWWESIDNASRSALQSRILDGNPVMPNDNIIFPKDGEPVVLNLKAQRIERI